MTGRAEEDKCFVEIFYLQTPQSASAPHWLGQRGRLQSGPDQEGGQVHEDVRGEHTPRPLCLDIYRL